MVTPNKVNLSTIASPQKGLSPLGKIQRAELGNIGCARTLVEQFVDSLSSKANVGEAWTAFIKAKKSEELDQIIADESLNAIEKHTFVENIFRDGIVPDTGTAITKILPPVSRFSKTNEHALKKQSVFKRLKDYFERYFGLG